MSFIQSVSNTSGAGSFTTWSISFGSVAAGHQMVLVLEFGYTGSIGFTVTDSLGTNWAHAEQDQISHTGSGIVAFSSETIAAGGANTITVSISGGGSLAAISACALEYSQPFTPAANTFPPGYNAWGLANPSFGSNLASGAGIGPSAFSCANEIWQPLTTYSANGISLFSSVVDTGPAPAHIQQAISTPGTSAATPPIWNHAGGITTESTGMQWQDASSRIAPALTVPILCVGSIPFVEFPAPGAGWILRAQISGISALSVYDQAPVTFESSFAIAVAKTVDSYQLDTMLYNQATKAPAAAGGVEATFTGFFGPGHIGGGTI